MPSHRPRLKTGTAWMSGIGPPCGIDPTRLSMPCFERVAKAHPQRTALVWEGGKLTYGELDRRSDALAISLIAAGVEADAPVALCMPRSAEAIVAALAYSRREARIYRWILIIRGPARVRHQGCGRSSIGDRRRTV